MNLKTYTRLPIITLTVLLTAFLFAGNSAAETAAAEESELVCQNWMTNIVAQKGSWAGETNPQIIKVDELIENDTLLARIYTISPDGFVIVPILKDMAPVKFYTDEGRFDMNQRFAFPQMIREILQNRIRVYVETYGSLDAVQPPDGEVMFGREHRQQWDTYNVAKASFSTSLDVTDLGPLLTSRWHQFEPYWNLCPYGDGDRCVVGCVATAAAQIFKYHQWPPEGEGFHSYWWAGDNSCEGSSPGLTLSAEFWDPYDWANIPDNCDGGCTQEQNDALAEFNYEVAIAFDMDFGVCGSGAWPNPSAYSSFFKYRDLVMYFYRNSYSAASWFSMIVDELNQDRPIMYLIENHAIVCDGWRISGEIYQYHMNYGWGGSYNGWYTVDNLHCAVEGCSYLDESMQRFIIPDRRSMFTSSNNVGWVPLDVSFFGASEFQAVDAWKWDFGDGDSAMVQEPVHTYNTPGVFDVGLQVDSGGGSYYYEKTKHVVALADTVRGTDVQGPLDSTLEIPIYVTNNLPLYRLQIPIEYDGPLTLKYKGHSTTGCRTDYFDDINYINYDANNKRFTFNMETGSQADLPAGTGPVVIIKFDILSGPANETNPLVFDGYTSYEPKFFGDLAEYNPALASGGITFFYEGCCIGLTGNADCAGSGEDPEEPDISDIVRIIDFLYLSHDPLCCLEEADVDASGPSTPEDPTSAIDISDIVFLIDHLYLSHKDLMTCP